MKAGLATLAALVAVLAGAAPAAAAPLEFVRMWGSEGTGPGQFRIPDGIAVDLAGDVYVTDRENNRVQKFDSTGRLLAIWGRNGGDGSLGLGAGEFNGPYAVATDGVGDVYVLDSRNNRVQKLSSTGRFLGMWGRNGGDGSYGAGPGEFSDPRGIEVDRRGVVYVSDHGNNRIQVFTTAGRLLAIWGRNGGDGSAGTGNGEFHGPRSASTDRAGDVYVVEKFNHRVQKLAPDGSFITRWGRNGGAGGGDAAIGSGDGEFNLPYDGAVDSEGRVYVVDTSNTRLQVFDVDGQFLAKWGTPGTGAGEFHDPYQVAVDCLDNVYVTDEHNSRVQVFGDPDAPEPRCPPRVRVGGAEWSDGRNAAVVDAVCDQPCRVRVRGTIEVAGGERIRAVSRLVRMGAEDAAGLVLRPRGAADEIEAALRGGDRVIVRTHTTASGFGGRSRAVRRTARLRD